MKTADAEIARVLKEVTKLKMESDIFKKPQLTSRRSRCEIRLRGETPGDLTCESDVRSVPQGLAYTRGSPERPASAVSVMSSLAA